MTHPTEDELTIADYEEVLADKRRLTRLLDVAMHGEDGAAKQASLCDLIEPAKRMRERIKVLEDALRIVVGNASKPVKEVADIFAQPERVMIISTSAIEAANRFLAWQLPEDFNPDGGIHYTPSNHRPTGTNLFTASQAEAMMRHILASQESWDKQRAKVDFSSHDEPIYRPLGEIPEDKYPPNASPELKASIDALNKPPEKR